MDDISNDFYTDNNENEFYEDEDDEEEFENNSLNGRLSVNNFQNINEDSSASMLLESKPRKRKSSIDLSKYCKKRKCRTTFSKDQLDELEKEFTNSNFISNDRVDLMIELTGLDSRIIKVSEIIYQINRILEPFRILYQAIFDAFKAFQAIKY